MRVQGLSLRWLNASRPLSASRPTACMDAICSSIISGPMPSCAADGGAQGHARVCMAGRTGAAEGRRPVAALHTHMHTRTHMHKHMSSLTHPHAHTTINRTFIISHSSCCTWALKIWLSTSATSSSVGSIATGPSVVGSWVQCS